MKVISILLTLLLIVTPPSRNNTIGSFASIKQNKIVNIREEPNPTSNICITLYSGEIFEVVSYDISSGYVKIKTFDGLEGYVLRTLVDSEESEVLAISSMQEEIIMTAKAYIGTKYVWGGNSLTKGVDCSGYIKQIWQTQGIILPRTAQTMSVKGFEVEESELQPCDLLFFGDSVNKITHVAMYIGEGNFIHSGSGDGGVAIGELNKKWYRNNLVLCRRLI